MASVLGLYYREETRVWKLACDGCDRIYLRRQDNLLSCIWKTKISIYKYIISYEESSGSVMLCELLEWRKIINSEANR